MFFALHLHLFSGLRAKNPAYTASKEFVFPFSRVSTTLPPPPPPPPNQPIHTQTLYKNRLCRCKPRASSPSSSSSNEEDDASVLGSIAAKTAEDFSELIGLCRSWEKDARLASLALEGALCCLRSLKGRPASAKSANGSAGGVESKGGNGDGGGEALDAALKALAAAVGDFFGKRRGGGLTATQVCFMCAFASVSDLRVCCVVGVCCSWVCGGIFVIGDPVCVPHVCFTTWCLCGGDVPVRVFVGLTVRSSVRIVVFQCARPTSARRVPKCDNSGLAAHPGSAKTAGHNSVLRSRQTAAAT